MTRDDLSFLIEKATGLLLLVIGLEWLPGLIDGVLGSGVMTPSTRQLALHTLVPLAAGAFLLWRRRPPAVVPAAATSPSAMTRAEWLWVGLKMLGAFVMLYGFGNLVSLPSWAMMGYGTFPLGVAVQQAFYLLGGAWLLFGTRVWRLACRE